MKIYWASVRKASDLCSTTTHALLEGIGTIRPRGRISES